MNQMNAEMMQFLKDFVSEYEQREKGLHTLLERQSTRLEALEEDLKITRENYSEIKESFGLLKTYCDQISNNQREIMKLFSEQDSTRSRDQKLDDDFFDEIKQGLGDENGGSYGL